MIGEDILDPYMLDPDPWNGTLYAAYSNHNYSAALT